MVGVPIVMDADGVSRLATASDQIPDMLGHFQHDFLFVVCGETEFVVYTHNHLMDQCL